MYIRGVILIIVFLPVSLLAQKKKDKHALDSLVADDGWVVRVGDTVKIGLGSLPNGDYKYITNMSIGGVLLTPSNNANNNSINKLLAGESVVINRIEKGVLFFKQKFKYVIFFNQAVMSKELITPNN